jgi:hypothetical protein
MSTVIILANNIIAVAIFAEGHGVTNLDITKVHHRLLFFAYKQSSKTFLLFLMQDKLAYCKQQATQFTFAVFFVNNSN